MNYTPTCPYVTDVEVQAWGEGLTYALHDDNYLGRNEANPYTSGDTCVAWATGWGDGKYKPAVFDFTAISDLPKEIQTYINITVQADREAGYNGVIKGMHLVWTWTGGTLYEADQPAWVSNKWQHRSVPIDRYDVTRIVRQHLQNTHVTAPETIELPCPPYSFTYSGGGMRISQGVFTKWGDKDDWQAVINSMQEALDAAPQGINVEDVSVTVDVSATATARWSSQVSATDLLSTHDDYDDGVWSGSMDDLADALDEAVCELDSSEVSDDYADIEYEMDYYGDTNVEASDINYDLDQAVEL